MRDYDLQQLTRLSEREQRAYKAHTAMLSVPGSVEADWRATREELRMAQGMLCGAVRSIVSPA